MNLEKTKVIYICDKICLFSIYAVVFFLPISKAIIETFSYLAIAIFFVKKSLERKSIPYSYFYSAILIFTGICLASVFMSSNSAISARSFLGKIIHRVAFFFVIADTLNSERRLKNAIIILFFSSTLLGIDGVYQFFTHKDFIRHRPHDFLPRIYATFPSPSDFGCYLNTAIIFVLVYFFIKSRFKFVKFLLICLFILLFACLMLTASRGAWFAFIASILFMSIWVRFSPLFFIILGIYVTILYHFHPYIKVVLNRFFIFLDVSSVERRMMWEAAWKMFMSRPWLGVGLGTFMFNFRKFVVPEFSYIAYAHNCYLQILAETGILGLLSFLSILALFFYKGIRMMVKAQRVFSWYVLLGSLTAILSYSLQMGVDTFFYSVDLGILFWLILGIGIAAAKNLEAVKIVN